LPTVSKKTQPKKAVQNTKSAATDLDAKFDKYFWLVIPILAIVYYLSSKYSPGFYQDDEIGHFINMKEFWNDPFVILGNWPKPGYKLFMVLPSLFGYETVLFFNALIASATVYLTYVLIKAYDIPYAFFGALILALQPLFFDLSFRSYAEIFTALLLVLMILLYKKEMYMLAALTCGYVFTVRQEAALIGIVMAVMLFMKKQYLAIVLLGVFPFLFNLFGYFKSGDILYVITEMNTLGAMYFGGDKRGFFHYFKVYIFIIGPVCLTLFLLGFFGFLQDTSKAKQYFGKYSLPYIVFLITFLVQAMLMVQGVNPGTWRYLLHTSPIAAFFAALGLSNLAGDTFKKTAYILTGVLIFFTLVFLSKDTNGLDLTDASEYGKLAVVGIAGVLIIALSGPDKKAYLNKLSVALILLSAVYLMMSFKPRQYSPENLAVKQMGAYLAGNEFDSKKIIVTTQTSSPVFLFGDFPADRKKNFVHLNKKNLENAQKGDIIVWDSHYGYRPEYQNDVKFEILQNDPDLKLLNQFASSDKRYQAFVFEKIN
jgi:hypothetical protein